MCSLVILLLIVKSEALVKTHQLIGPPRLGHRAEICTCSRRRSRVPAGASAHQEQRIHTRLTHARIIYPHGMNGAAEGRRERERGEGREQGEEVVDEYGRTDIRRREEQAYLSRS